MPRNGSDGAGEGLGRRGAGMRGAVNGLSGDQGCGRGQDNCMRRRADRAIALYERDPMNRRAAAARTIEQVHAGRFRVAAAVAPG